MYNVLNAIEFSRLIAWVQHNLTAGTGLLSDYDVRELYDRVVVCQSQPEVKPLEVKQQSSMQISADDVAELVRLIGASLDNSDSVDPQYARINAIKMYRNLTGVGLKDAKIAIDRATGRPVVD